MLRSSSITSLDCAVNAGVHASAQTEQDHVSKIMTMKEHQAEIKSGTFMPDQEESRNMRMNWPYFHMV